MAVPRILLVDDEVSIQRAVAPLLRSPAGVYLRPLLARVSGVVYAIAARGRDRLSPAP